MTSLMATPDDLKDLGKWSEHRYETDQVFRYKADRAALMAKKACPVEISDECFKAMLIGAIVALYLEGAEGVHSVHSKDLGEVTPNE